MAEGLPAHITLDLAPWQPHLHSAVMSMSLKRIDAQQWLQRSDLALSAYAANKRTQTAALGDKVLHVLPQAESAVQELACLIEDELQLPRAVADNTTQRLYDCSLAVAEDLVVLQAGDEGYYINAAHLCAPSHWLLEDKIGRAMDPVHAPVPGYQPALGRSVNLFLDKLPAERVVERFNWSIDEKPELCQRPNPAAKAAKRELKWYRVERQTLRRLPQSGAIVFGILVRQWPLWFLAEHGGQAGLEQALLDLPPMLKEYKSLGEGAVLNWGKA